MLQSDSLRSDFIFYKKKVKKKKIFFDCFESILADCSYFFVESEYLLHLYKNSGYMVAIF